MDEIRYPRQSESVKSLTEAMCKVHAKIKPAKKTKTSNAQRNSTYADLVDCVNASREILAENNIEIEQHVLTYEEADWVHTIKKHSTSGEFSESRIYVGTIHRKDFDRAGGCTYWKRQAYNTIIGLVCENEDIEVVEDEDSSDNQQATESTENAAYSPKQENMIRAKAKYSPQFLRQTCEELNIKAKDVGELLPQLTKQTTRQLLNRICELEEQAKATK